MAQVTTKLNPDSYFTIYEAWDHYYTGEGQTVYVDAANYMAYGPGSVVSLSDFVSRQKMEAWGQLQAGTTLEIDEIYRHYHYTQSLFSGNYLEAAYVWGSSSHRFVGNVTVNANNTITIVGQIRPFDEEFDFEANSKIETYPKAIAEFISSMSAGWQTGAKYYIQFVNKDNIKISNQIFDIHNSLFDDAMPCFPAGTPVTLPDGSTLPIEQIAPENIVAAFAERGVGDDSAGRRRLAKQWLGRNRFGAAFRSSALQVRGV